MSWIVIGGIALAIGVAVGTTYAATSDERALADAEANVARYKQELENCKLVIKSLNDLRNKLDSGKTYLTNAKNDFSNGGHVVENLPLANSEFSSCFKKIDYAMSDIDNLIKKYDSVKEDLRKKINELIKKYSLDEACV